MSNISTRLNAITAKLSLPPQRWKMQISEHQGDQRFLLEQLKKAVAVIEFYAGAPGDSILYWDEAAQAWFDDNGQRARDAMEDLERSAGN